MRLLREQARDPPLLSLLTLTCSECLIFGCAQLFELLTLKQTGKVQRSLPVVLLGKAYWKSVINWQTLGIYGVINPSDVDELLFTDDVQEAFDFIVRSLEAGPSLWSDQADEGDLSLKHMTS